MRAHVRRQRTPEPSWRAQRATLRRFGVDGEDPRLAVARARSCRLDRDQRGCTRRCLATVPRCALRERSEVTKVGGDDQFCTDLDGDRDDVAVFGVVRHLRDQALVTGDHRVGKRSSHGIDQASCELGCRLASRDEIAGHLVEDHPRPVESVPIGLGCAQQRVSKRKRKQHVGVEHHGKGCGNHPKRLLQLGIAAQLLLRHSRELGQRSLAVSIALALETQNICNTKAPMLAGFRKRKPSLV
jgi:hypothetical protein